MIVSNKNLNIESIEVIYLASEESGTTLRDLEDDGGLGIASSLKRSNDGGGGGDVL